MRKHSKSTSVIPKEFTIGGGRKIKVEQIDKYEDTDDSKFGDYNVVTNVITIANNVKVNNSFLPQTEEDKERTFYHELIHTFQFFSGIDFDEMIAQTFSNFLYEYFKSRKSN